MLQIGRSQFVAAEEFATEQVGGFAPEETRRDLRAKVRLGALDVVLGVVAS